VAALFVLQSDARRDERLVARTLAEALVSAIGADTAEDEPRVDGQEGVGVCAEARRYPGPE
jgi:hypothetical protein